MWHRTIISLICAGAFWACLGPDSNFTPTITTRFGIAIPPDVVFDSSVCVIRVNSQDSSVIVRYPADLGTDQKLRWDVIAPEGSTVSIQTNVFYLSNIIATQDLAFISGDATIRVPEITRAPTLKPLYPWAAQQGLDSVTLWAIAQSTDKSELRTIDSISWDFNNDGLFETTTLGDTSVVRLALPQIPADFVINMRIYERSGRTFDHQNTIGAMHLSDSTSIVGPLLWMNHNSNIISESTTFYDQNGCYNSNDSLCQVYGRLYSAEAARKACPTGWHLPTQADLFTLIHFHGGVTQAGQALKSKSSAWRSQGGQNVLGFAALPAGIRVTYDQWRSDSLGVLAAYWINVKSDSSALFTIMDRADSVGIHWNNPSDMASVRCVRPVEE